MPAKEKALKEKEMKSPAPKERDSLPKRPTDSMMESVTSRETVRQVSSEVKQVSSEMTRTSEMARTSELAVKESVVKQSVSTVKQINSKESKINMMVLPSIIHSNGLSLQDVQQREPDQLGLLSLKHLNTLLLRYIGVVHGLEEDSMGEENGEIINITIDEKEVSFLDARYKEEMQVWSAEEGSTKAKIADLKKLIEKLKEEVARLIKCGDEFDATIKVKEKEIERLRLEVAGLESSLTEFLHSAPRHQALAARSQAHAAFLTGQLSSALTAFQAEEVRGDDLGDRLNSLKAELQFKIEVLETELVAEREKTTVDINSMDVRMKGEYASRLKVEIDILRGTYDEFMRGTRERLEDKYKNRLAGLQLQLSLALSKQSSEEDIAKIRAQMVELRKSIELLTSSNLELSQAWSRLSVELHEEEASFRAQVAVKEREIEHYTREATRLQEMWEELSQRLLEERAEVQVYDRLLTPEVQRMRSRHSSTSSVPAL